MKSGRSFLVPLITLIMLVISMISNIHGCDSDDDGISDARLAANLMLRMGDMISGGALLKGILWIFYDVTGATTTDLTKQMECYANKHLKEYHMDRINIIINNFNRKLNTYKDDETELEELLDDIESASTMSYMQSNLKNTQAAIYPSIAPWALLHMAVYKKLIGVYRKKMNDGNCIEALIRGDYDCKYNPVGHGMKLTELEGKSDKWLIFYAKLMLRYHRIHKYKLTEYMKLDDVRRSKILESPAKLVKPWLKLAFDTKTKGKLSNLIDSCKLTSGDVVQFKYIYKTPYDCNGFACRGLRSFLNTNKFFSCWGSGSSCKATDCPKEKILVYGSSYPDYWACRGNVFQIYADKKSITHQTIVNVLYSKYPDKSYYVSGDTFETNNKATTKTCPGASWGYIRSDCDKENFKIAQWDYNRSTTTSINHGFIGISASFQSFIYDGSYVQFNPSIKPYFDHPVFELHIAHSECSKDEHVNPPF